MINKHNFQRLISIVLSLVLLLGCFSITAPIKTEAADKTYTQGNYTYTVSSGCAKIVSFPETVSGEISVPSELGGYKVTEIGEYAFYACTTLTKVTIPNTVVSIGSYAFAFCVELEYILIPSSVKTFSSNIFKSSNKVVIYCINNSKAYNYAKNNSIDYVIIQDIYNMGEESYSFDNYGDHDSSGGHCFGMSITSSAYHIGKLDVSIIGLKKGMDIYPCSDSKTVREPICYYQSHQEFALSSTVAGGSYYRNKKYNINKDWEQVINYVNNHKYDDSGLLQIGIRKNGQGGHAINFLRYSVVDGQERIYAYDNNFPDNEVYFYRDSHGNVFQSPNSTFSGSIDCIALRDVSKYFDVSSKSKDDHIIYSERDEIQIEGIEEYPIDGGIEQREYVIFVIPSSEKSIKIIPLVDNASFTYANQEFSFGEISEDTYGILNLSDTDSEIGVDDFVIMDENSSCSCWCHKTGILKFFFNVILFFQRIFGLNQICSCGVKHY